jgi:septal ring factor EnvC (AmiA/AmiB activator)
VQTWLNPRLSPVQPISAELTWLQWSIRSSDFRYGTLQQEVHKLTVELDNARREASAFENKLKDQELQMSALQQTVEAQKHEMTGLRQQLEGWQKHWQSVENSAGWRLLSAWRSTRDLLAPEKTWRRRLYDSVISRLRPHALRGQL